MNRPLWKNLEPGRPESPRQGRPTDISRHDVLRLMDGGAQVVEVLPVREYEEDHLPGAISLPLRQLERRAREVLDPTRAVIVYCWDSA